MTKDRTLVAPTGPSELELTRGRIADYAHYLQSHVGLITTDEEAALAEQKLKEILVYLGWKEK